MPKCAVNVCLFSSAEAEISERTVSFHVFPKDGKARSHWVKFCGLNSDPGKTLYICSQHFSNECFKNNATIQNMVMPASKARNILVKNACPTIRKPCVPVSHVSGREKRRALKERKKMVEALLEVHEKQHPVDQQFEDSCSQEPSECFVPMSDATEQTETVAVSSGSNLDVLLEAIELSGGVHDSGFFDVDASPVDSIHVRADLESTRIEHSSSTTAATSATKVGNHVARLNSQVRRLKSTVQARNDKIKSLRLRVMQNNQKFIALMNVIKTKDKELKEKERQLCEKDCAVEHLRKACGELNDVREAHITQRVRKEFAKVFTENQIDLILGNKKKVVWTAEEIAKSFSLRYD
ncbi:uncharacterized protein LOC135715257 [Ochlerotatus camptorhynchus]|uniref:uncharacterized protein LOC135715257 n=1 Tax=Ochlerotatus camptorhynchus TaxID=644619 RepID=UPI0031D978DB